MTCGMSVSVNCDSASDIVAKMYKVVTFYRFVDIPNYTAIRDDILALAKTSDLRGTILLAKEGYNAICQY